MECDTGKYDIFHFGALYLGDKIQHVPQQPIKNGDVPLYDGKSEIFFGTASPKEKITWVKPNGMNLLVADRVLLIEVSWNDLNKSNFFGGKKVTIGGQCFRCRLLQDYNEDGSYSEWDKILDITGRENSLWHWLDMWFLGADIVYANPTQCVIYGSQWARRKSTSGVKGCYPDLGFRPVLEPIRNNAFTPNCKLDGVDFLLSSIPDNTAFCPVLQPIRDSVFADIEDGHQVRMYTVLDGETPIHFGAAIEDTRKLTLTDRYYGDEYLIPWVISNGVAVASQSLKQQI